MPGGNHRDRAGRLREPFCSTPPGKLYQLTPPTNFPASLPHATAQLLIDLPQARAGIDTSRIALSKSPLSLDYFADFGVDRPGTRSNPEPVARVV